MTQRLIRQIKRSDIKAVAQLAEQGFGKFYQFDWHANAHGLLKASREGRAAVAVAEVAGRVVGYCNLRSWPAGGWIDQIVVDTAHRGQGIGRALLDFIIEQARQKGYWKISLIVSASDAAATAFYKKYGFETVGGMKDEIKKGEDGILLSYIVSYELHPNR